MVREESENGGGKMEIDPLLELDDVSGPSESHLAVRNIFASELSSVRKSSIPPLKLATIFRRAIFSDVYLLDSFANFRTDLYKSWNYDVGGDIDTIIAKISALNVMDNDFELLTAINSGNPNSFPFKIPTNFAKPSRFWCVFRPVTIILLEQSLWVTII